MDKPEQGWKGNWMQPVLEEEKELTKTDWAFVKTCVMAHQKVIVDKVFLRVGKEKLEKVFREDTVYQALLKTDKRNVAVEVSLRKFQGYEEKLEEIKQVFRKNMIKWMPVIESYFQRFAEVVITKVKGMLLEEEKVQGIEIDYGDMQGDIINNQILAWNLTLDTRKSTGFPIPQMDHKSYKYTLQMNSEREGILILLREEDEYLVRKKDKVEIISKESGIHNRKIFHIKKPEIDILKNSFPILGNQIGEEFVNRYAEHFGTVVCTRGELERKIQSLGVDEYIYFEDAGISEQKVIQLTFCGTEKEKWLHRDILDYVIEVLSEQFNDYKIVGELV